MRSEECGMWNEECGMRNFCGKRGQDQTCLSYAEHSKNLEQSEKCGMRNDR